MKNLPYKIHSRTTRFLKKVETAEELISRKISSLKNNVYVSWSGGKDSTVVLDLARKQKPNVCVFHMKSGYELPDGYQYMIELSSTWKLNLIELISDIDYFDLCIEFGLPHMRSKETQLQVVKKIKKNPATNWAKKNGFHGLFWGLRSQESVGRRHYAKSYGEIFKDKNGFLKISPILHWSSMDVWAYFEYAKIPISPVYLHENCGFTRETIRNTGWLSTDGETRGRLEWLRRNYPQQHQKLRGFL